MEELSPDQVTVDSVKVIQDEILQLRKDLKKNPSYHTAAKLQERRRRVETYVKILRERIKEIGNT